MEHKMPVRRLVENGEGELTAIARSMVSAGDASADIIVALVQYHGMDVGGAANLVHRLGNRAIDNGLTGIRYEPRTRVQARRSTTQRQIDRARPQRRHAGSWWVIERDEGEGIKQYVVQAVDRKTVSANFKTANTISESVSGPFKDISGALDMVDEDAVILQKRRGNKMPIDRMFKQAFESDLGMDDIVVGNTYVLITDAFGVPAGTEVTVTNKGGSDGNDEAWRGIITVDVLDGSELMLQVVPNMLERI